MKTVLIVTEGFHLGGVEISLRNFLSQINPKEYSVDVFCLSNSTTSLDLKNVNHIYYGNEEVLDFSTELISSIRKLLKKRLYRFAIRRFLLSFLAKTKYKKSTTFVWKSIRRYLHSEVFSKKYDIAIAYKDGLSWYCVDEFVLANRKIAWVHIPFSKSNCDVGFTQKTFRNYQSINCVSNDSKKEIDEYFRMSEKSKVVYSFIDSDSIIEMSKESCQLEVEKDSLCIITVARLTSPKGIDLVLDASKVLRSACFNFKWYIIGDGVLHGELNDAIARYELKNNVYLLGGKSNPYPYMRRADIYVQPSKYEGYGLTLAEAKLLSKRIVCTNIPTFLEQDDGSITYVEADAQKLSETILNYKESTIFRGENIEIPKSKLDIRNAIEL